MTDEYTDVRSITPGYTTIPCKVCEEPFYVQNSFTYNFDTWYCDDCLPQDLREVRETRFVEVNL